MKYKQIICIFKLHETFNSIHITHIHIQNEFSRNNLHGSCFIFRIYISSLLLNGTQFDSFHAVDSLNLKKKICFDLHNNVQKYY